MKKLSPDAKELINRMLPVGSRRRQAVKVLISRRGKVRVETLSYKQWIKTREPRTLHREVVRNGPLISLVVPCYNTPKRYIDELVASLINQSYTKWQLCLGDGSTEKSCSENIKNAASRDKRIVYIKLSKNLGISGNTNKAIQKTKGVFTAFLDHDDILPSWALNEVAAAIKNNPTAEVFYTDEDRLSDDGKTRMIPLFKPDWSLDLFLSVNYAAHFLVMKSSLIKKLKGLRSEFDGSQDYDLLLRALEYNPQVIHIPKVLYHMRMADSSTGKQITIKDYVHDTGNKALAGYVQRNNIQAKVLAMTNMPTNHRIKYELKDKPLVSIIIPFKDKVALLKACVKSIINKTTYQNYEIILLTNNSKEKATFTYLDKIKKDKRVHVYAYDKPFNYSAINNFGRGKANGEVLVFLNNDTEVITPEWLEELTSVARRNNTGAVGPQLLYPDGTIQHAGVVLGMMGAAGHVFRTITNGDFTSFMLPDWPRNYLAVTGACLCVEAKKFDLVNGFDERIIVAGSDVTLCLKLYESGHVNVYWPFAQLYHYESKTVGSYQKIPSTDYDYSIENYRPYLNYNDPYFNPNLDLNCEQPKLRVDYET